MKVIETWIKSYEQPITTIFQAVILIAAIVIMGILLVKAVIALKDGKIADVAKFILWAVLAFAISLLGIAGVKALSDKLFDRDTLTAPKASIQTTTNDSFASNTLDSGHIIHYDV